MRVRVVMGLDLRACLSIYTSQSLGRSRIQMGYRDQVKACVEYRRSWRPAQREASIKVISLSKFSPNPISWHPVLSN